MKNLIIAGMLLLGITGCNTLEPIFFDPRITSPAIELSVDESQPDGVHFVMLPPAFTDAFSPYTRQFIADSAEFLAKKQLQNHQAETQQHFYNAAGSQGGLYSSATGALDTGVLSCAIKKTASDLFESDPDVQGVAFIHPYRENIERVNGLAVWENTEQKQSVIPGTTRATGSAVTLKVNYILRNGEVVSRRVGLDADEAQFVSAGKYRNIVAYVLSPLLPSL